ncbi:MAG: hypothetical protein M1835_003739 [Candelina submexicana]|nr:MAG: hypothetical protein M1835_003739 [Candelina submexicana]
MPKQATHNQLHNTTSLDSGSSKGVHENGVSLISHSNASQVSLPTSCGSSDATENSISLSDVGPYSSHQAYSDLIVTRGYGPYGQALSNPDKLSPAYSGTWRHDAVQAVSDHRLCHVPQPEGHVFYDPPESIQGPQTTDPNIWPLSDSRTTNGEQMQSCSSHQPYPEQYLETSIPYVSSVSASDSLISFHTHSKLLPASSISRRSSVTQPDDVSIGTSTLASQDYLPFPEYNLDESLAAPLNSFHPADMLSSDKASNLRRQAQCTIQARQSELTQDHYQLSPTQEADIGPPRDHPLYQAVPQEDGLYHCPYESEEGCAHKPEKLKCNYDKHVDSHLKPYRCKLVTCTELRFSSTACLLRHEREAHGMHGHGAKPHLCSYEDCERSMPGNGFPRRWNLFDHMRRVHDYTGPPSSTGSTSPPLSPPDYVQVPSPKGQQSRKRKVVDGNNTQVTKRNKSICSATAESTWTVVSSRVKERTQHARNLEIEWAKRHAMLKDRLNKIKDPHDSHEHLQEDILALQDIAIDVRRYRVAHSGSNQPPHDIG